MSLKTGKIGNATFILRRWDIGMKGIRLSVVSGVSDSGLTLPTADALALWHEIGELLDEIQPGATGLRPLPDGDPNEVDAMILREAADKLRENR